MQFFKIFVLLASSLLLCVAFLGGLPCAEAARGKNVEERGITEGPFAQYLSVPQTIYGYGVVDLFNSSGDLQQRYVCFYRHTVVGGIIYQNFTVVVSPTTLFKQSFELDLLSSGKGDAIVFPPGEGPITVPAHCHLGTNPTQPMCKFTFVRTSDGTQNQVTEVYGENGLILDIALNNEGTPSSSQFRMTWIPAEAGELTWGFVL